MMKNQLAGLMKQAQAMQDNMKKAQEQLAQIEVEDRYRDRRPVGDRRHIERYLLERHLEVELFLERRGERVQIPVVGLLVLRAVLEHQLLDEVVGEVIDPLALLDHRDRGLVRRPLDDRALVGGVALELDDRAEAAV